MTTLTYAGADIDVDGEGFLQQPEQWNEQVAQEIAAENGIEELTDRHWLVIRFMRNTFLESGSAPSIRTRGGADALVKAGDRPATVGHRLGQASAGGCTTRNMAPVGSARAAMRP